jgi:hypothetical protein
MEELNERKIVSSDKRIKNSIQKIKSGEAKLADGLNLYSFYYNGDEDRRVYGVIAQEVKNQSLHQLVHEKEDGMMGVDYTSFLILKVKALSDRIEALEKMLENKKSLE